MSPPPGPRRTPQTPQTHFLKQQLRSSWDSLGSENRKPTKYSTNLDKTEKENITLDLRDTGGGDGGGVVVRIVENVLYG